MLSCIADRIAWKEKKLLQPNLTMLVLIKSMNVTQQTICIYTSPSNVYWIWSSQFLSLASINLIVGSISNICLSVIRTFGILRESSVKTSEHLFS